MFAPSLSFSCYCDALCYVYDDCCDDISSIGCYEDDSKFSIIWNKIFLILILFIFVYIISVTTVDTVLPYITLGVTEGVTTQSVPPQDDGVSLSIDVNFPFGSQNQSTVYIC